MNEVDQELSNQVRYWLESIHETRDICGITKNEQYDILGSLDEYVEKFRTEFRISTDSTIKEAEDVLYSELEDNLHDAMEMIEDAWAEADAVLNSNYGNLRDYLDFCHCDCKDELFDLAQEDKDIAEESWEKATKVLNELESLESKDNAVDA